MSLLLKISMSLVKGVRFIIASKDSIAKNQELIKQAIELKVAVLNEVLSSVSCQ